MLFAEHNTKKQAWKNKRKQKEKNKSEDDSFVS